MAFWERKKKRVIGPRQVDRFKAILDDNKVEEAKLMICRLAGKGRGATLRTLSEIMLTDLDSDTMEGYLEENYGDGNYRVKITKIDKTKNFYLGQVDYFIGEEDGHISNLESRIINDYFDVIKTKLSASNGDGFEGELRKAMVTRLLADPNDAMLKTLEVVDMIAQRSPQPQIAESDPTTLLLTQILGPVVSNIIQSKFGNSLAMAQAPEPVRLPGDTPRPLGSLNNPEKTPIENQTVHAIPEEKKPEFQTAFETIFLNPIKDTAITTPAEDIAERIYVMIGYCQSLPSEQIHPAVRGLIEGMSSGDEAQLQAGFITLCQYLRLEQSKALEVASLLNEMDKLSREKYEALEKENIIDSTASNIPAAEEAVA